MERKQTSKRHLPTGDHRGGQVRRPKEATKWHSPTGDHRGRDKSRCGKKVTEQVTLTNWRPEKEEQVRTWKESD
jgi:hypothetical protein